jgi:hypothetical protein
VKIPSLRSKAESEPTVGPAREAFDHNRQRADSLASALAEKVELAALVRAALAEAEAKVTAPSALRERIAEVEARIQATLELRGGVVDASPLADLRQQLADAERDAAEAAPRVRVEKYKGDAVAAEIATLSAAQHDVQAQHAPLAVEALWEDLSTKAAALTAARNDYMAAFDAAFSTARAIDILAEAMKSGRFAGAHTARELVLPVVTGMDELGYSQEEHLTKIENGAVSILKGLGLHA